MPIPGTTPNLALTQSQSANQGGVLALAFGRSSLPFLGGTLLIQAPVLTLPFGTVPSGTTQFPIPLPNDPSLGASVPATWQIVLVSAPGVAMTNGMEWRFGL